MWLKLGDLISCIVTVINFTRTPASELVNNLRTATLDCRLLHVLDLSKANYWSIFPEISCGCSLLCLDLVVKILCEQE